MPLIMGLFQWIRDNGGFVDDSLIVSGTTQHDRGVYTTSVHSPDEILMIFDLIRNFRFIIITRVHYWMV